MEVIKEIHSDTAGQLSWTRIAGTITLILLFVGLFVGTIEWGQAFVGALALVFGLKGTQKWRERNVARKREEREKLAPSKTE